MIFSVAAEAAWCSIPVEGMRSLRPYPAHPLEPGRPC